MKTIELSVTRDYVSDWGQWEAIRELIQNAIDADSTAFIHNINSDIVIHSLGDEIGLGHFLLGKTSKKGDLTKIGKFGEGMKLALLVLGRLGIEVEITTGPLFIRPVFEMSDQFGAEVLKLKVIECSPMKGVHVRIAGASLDSIKDKWRPDLPLDTPLKDLPGKIFVRGLFVGEDKDFQYGYNLSKLQLDRDRRMPSNFDLTWATSQIWSRQNKMGEVLRLIDKKAPDVAHVKYHASASFGSGVLSAYRSQHGNKVPVSTQEEVEKAVASGTPFQLVSESLKDLLWAAAGFFIPTKGTPKQRLTAYIKAHEGSMTASQVKELTAIKDMLK